MPRHFSFSRRQEERLRELEAKSQELYEETLTSIQDEFHKGLDRLFSEELPRFQQELTKTVAKLGADLLQQQLAGLPGSGVAGNVLQSAVPHLLNPGGVQARPLANSIAGSLMQTLGNNREGGNTELLRLAKSESQLFTEFAKTLKRMMGRNF